ncbi:hypothetical protein [Carnobacterium maltaromaticum]|uniref:hypothetical protein n=1 Tax=Carnobacterium maltaromaticum TaxID=2751 RepID=UPI00059FC9C5|nr:hypothetical protein [Carnobacterium maltaromaticum]
MVIKTLYSQMYNEVKNHIGTFPFELNVDGLEQIHKREDIVDTFEYFLDTNFITGTYEDQYYKLILQVDSSNISSN